MKIYTGSGDRGRTSLFSGERLEKNSLRVSAYGTVDELCSCIGVVETALPKSEKSGQLTADLHQIQAHLFDMGALLATSPEAGDGPIAGSLSGDSISWLERQIDSMQDELPELHAFILPGGHPSAAWSQMARTVCRRAEREIITCLEGAGGTYDDIILAYINRLSDYFFVLARYLNKLSETAEITWHGK